MADVRFQISQEWYTTPIDNKLQIYGKINLENLQQVNWVIWTSSKLDI